MPVFAGILCAKQENYWLDNVLQFGKVVWIESPVELSTGNCQDSENGVTDDSGDYRQNH